MWLSELKSQYFVKGEKYPFLVSLGSTEQHGPYGPLGTDTFIQEALLKEVEAHLPELIILPTIPISDSTLQVGFPGTITFKTETVRLILHDITDSLKDYARIIFFVSWHGGNKPIIEEYIKQNSATYPNIHFVHLTFGDEKTDTLVTSILGGPHDDHAGNTEISLMQLLEPQCTGVPDVHRPKQYTQYNWDVPVIERFQDGIVDSNPKWVTGPEIGKQFQKIYSDNLITKIRKFL